MTELDLIYRSIASWGIPLGVLGVLHYLQQISKRLNEIGQNLAVAITRQENHEQRLIKLESKRH